MLQPDVLYTLGLAGDWVGLIQWVRRHRREIAADLNLTAAVRTTLAGLFADEWSRHDPFLLHDALGQLHLLHLTGTVHLTEAEHRRLVTTLAGWYAESDPFRAVDYARFFPDEDVCAGVLRRFSAADGSETVPIEPEDHTRPLFRSQAESAFFEAVRQVFPTFAVYPNVALSSVVDFSALKHQLDRTSRGYFFRAIIDCVVFDQHDGYRPLHFFELDSPYHDDPKRAERDALKTRILALAGRPLFRLRPPDPPDTLVDAVRRVVG
ncbi:MAG: DUF2726 domain-containing protein [Bacteroidota bacterium]